MDVCISLLSSDAAFCQLINTNIHDDNDDEDDDDDDDFTVQESKGWSFMRQTSSSVTKLCHQILRTCWHHSSIASIRCDQTI